MIIILCLDNNNGMMFNDRRQSQDRGLREYIAEMTKGEKVYMNAYTEKLYEEINDPVVCEEFLHKAGKGETCIVENLPLKSVIDQIEEIALDRVRRLFSAEHANVQPHSGANATTAAYLALMKPGDTALGLSLDHGGHITHGLPVSLSGQFYNFIGYKLKG